jgi:hypothetical protein
MAMTKIFGCFIPTAMADVPPAWQGFWAHVVESRGYQPAGEPTITEADGGFGERSRWIVQGPVQAADQTDSTAARNDSSGTAV